VRILGDAELRAALPARAAGAHKGYYGHVLVIGGDHGYAGAARLAGEAALRGGSGLVSVATRPGHVGALVGARPELMAHGVDDASALQPLLARASVLAIGPGLGRGDWARELLPAALDSAKPLVLDADALNLLAGEPRRLDDAVLTPHPGEAARLLGTDTASVQRDRYAAALAIASRYGAVTVLKGAGTIVADAAGQVSVCPIANPGLASGGSGDVLCGVIAALRAQGLDARRAAEIGVFAHARAGLIAARGGARGTLAGDVSAALRAVLNP
jgi:NAD(P)H-hydrate epimerase